VTIQKIYIFGKLYRLNLLNADLQKIYDLFYLNHDFPTDNFYVFQSFMEGQAEDWDRTIDNLKALSLSAIFYVRYLIS